MVMIVNSPIDKVKFQNKTFYVKRDDLLDKDFNGNKARKFYYFLKQDLSKYSTIVSYGSNQSNAMYSLSVLAKIKDKKFIYYTDHLSTYLQNNLSGNLKYALSNKMELRFGKDFEIDDKTLFVKEGGAIQESSFGIKILANEIKQWIYENNKKNINIFLPSGTGTTALFLQKYIDIPVYTCSCVGGEEYLKKQFFDLEKNLNYHPKILNATFRKKHHFGKLYKSDFEMYNLLKKEINIEFDLLYDPFGWQVVLESDLKNVLYIHQGGIRGNETMLQRYKRKFKNY